MEGPPQGREGGGAMSMRAEIISKDLRRANEALDRALVLRAAPIEVRLETALKQREQARTLVRKQLLHGVPCPQAGLAGIVAVWDAEDKAERKLKTT